MVVTAFFAAHFAFPKLWTAMGATVFGAMILAVAMSPFFAITALASKEKNGQLDIDSNPFFHVLKWVYLLLVVGLYCFLALPAIF